jgi:hypothetical protein
MSEREKKKERKIENKAKKSNEERHKESFVHKKRGD